MSKVSKTQLIVDDKSILAFYNANPALDFVTMNLIFIDVLTKLSVNLSDTVANTTTQKMYKLLEKIATDVTTLQSDLFSKIQETRAQYVADIRPILASEVLTSAEKFSAIVAKNNGELMAKMGAIVGEAFPTHQAPMFSQVETSIKQLSASLSKDDGSHKEYVKAVDVYFTKISAAIQQNLQQTEDRTHGRLTDIHSKVAEQHDSHKRLSDEMDTFLNKYKYNSTVKGNVSEVNLLPVLQLIFNKDVVEMCTKESHTCDYRVHRHDEQYPTILIENKDYCRSVTSDEVMKFESDLNKQGCHGIFLSQSGQIIKKANYQIDIKNGLIHVYVGNVNYDYDRIKIAVDIIDALAPKLATISSDKSSSDTISILQEDVDSMFTEYCLFSKQKLALVDTIKTSNKQILEQIDGLQLNVIRKFISKNNLTDNHIDDTYKCTICNAYYGKNRAGLAAHKKTCKPSSSATESVNVPIPVINLELAAENSIATRSNKKGGKK